VPPHLTKVIADTLREYGYPDDLYAATTLTEEPTV
jgi:hypothetical protein